MATEKPAEAPVETPPIDEFANAFIEAVNSDNPDTTKTPPEPAAPAVAPEVDPAAPVEGAPAAEEGAVEGEKGEKAPETGEKPPETESLEAKSARLEAENAALKAPKPPEKAPPQAPQQAEKPPETGEKPPEAPPPGPAWYAFDDNEKVAIESFRKDWPDIAAATDVMVKQAAYNAVEYMFDTLRKQVLPRMKQYEEMSSIFAERLTLDVLKSAHPDYDTIYDDVLSWVDTLPAAFKHGAKQVMQSGSPDEVAELIATFKGSTGVKATTPAPAPKATTELSAAAKQAASRLRVVGSKRSTPIAAADPNDFDAAWTEAVNSGN